MCLEKMSLVVKLALVAGLSMALMAAVMIFAILEISYEKARQTAELKARTALGVFEDSLAGYSDTVRSGQPMAGHLHGGDLGRGSVRLPTGHARPDQ